MLPRKNVAHLGAKLRKDLKKAAPTIKCKNLENSALFVAHRLLVYNSRGHFYTDEIIVG